MLRKSVLTTLAVGALAMSSAHATDFNVRIVNLTSGIYYTPFLVTAHPEGTALFRTGEPASPGLQAMAEGGALDELVDTLTTLGATIETNPAGGVMGPGASTNVDLNTDGTDNVLLSVVAMLLPTNDAFMGLNAITIPTEPGTYVYNVPAYDSGTEANDEVLNGGGAPGVPGMPADPGGFAGTGASGVVTGPELQAVHIHRNALGDTDANGGASDLDSTVHRWLNPVARVIVTVR